MAGLDLQAFSPVTPEWVPRGYADTRLAWSGTFPDQPDSETRVEAATFENELVYFRVLGEWVQKPQPPREAQLGERAFILFFLLVVTGVLALVVFLVIRNLKLGRGDLSGARRLALSFFLISTAVWILIAHHLQHFNHELNKFLDGLAPSLMVGALTWTFYLALEPYARKTWPSLLLGWSRLITGRYRDPLVGRDILVGGVFFLFYVAVDAGGVVAHQLLEKPLGSPSNVRWETFIGAKYAVSWIQGWFINSAFYAFFVLVLLMILRIVLRRQWAATVVFAALIALFMGFSSSSGGGFLNIGAAKGLLLGVAWAVVLVRFGLVTFVVGLYFRQLVDSFPMTLDPGVWWSPTSFMAIAAILLVTGFGLYTALSGRGQYEDLARR
ncbi:MAG: hypothetical protein HKN12_08430 [Gemmatimonadetes bacterium]|nr:hypothetical protein [Gemmatimonadota bacterium]